MRVLLVEDNEDDALFIREELSATNIDIEHRERLEQALARLVKGGFDAVLLDLSLPDAHGLDTIDRVLGAAPGAAIVVLSGLNDEETAFKAVARGAQDYLIKGQVGGNLLVRSLRYAVQRHKSEENLKERNRELLVLRQISETILGSLDLKTVLENILEQAIRSCSFDLGNIRLLDTSGETLELAVTGGYRNAENVQQHRRIPRANENSESVFKDRILKEPCIEEQVSTCSGLKTFKREGVESIIMVPVRANNEVLGIIQLASRTPRKFKPEEVNLIETIGNQMGVAVQKAKLYEQSRRQALELERVNQLQADFTAMIAHDLRSPLMNISGAAEVMINGMFGDVNEEQKRWLGKILSNSHSLVNLVSDFLDVAKLEAGYVELSREPMDLRKLMDTSLDNFLILAQKNGIALTPRAPASLPMVRGDQRRLEQVLNNLLSNAVKFTHRGGSIELGAARADDRQVTVWVKDNGVGIPPGEMAQLFEKYRQGSNITESGHKGTGLGLLICKMVIQAHGGRIWAESEPGRGSTFYFSLQAVP